ncbi:MAG: LacI family DNA-binding transcriptional regulator [Salinivirgaceae bacterium]|jgi:LacI family transcriptional regulator|nr:LacI family DNA-binding transcriptional regulator [Salinivirgaceae bacterium]
MANKEITIYDIAKALGLSASTVSRALNENKVINKKTRKKVISYAESIGYQTNTFASNLRSQETKTIGVIVPKLDSKFISRCLAGAEKVATEKGYSLLISQSLENFEKEKANAKSMFKKRVDGLIVSLSKNSTSTTHFDPYPAKGIPVVFFDRTSNESEYSSYAIDNFDAGYRATKHLINQGCKNLIHITIECGCGVYKQRLDGFKKAIHEANLKNNGNILILDKLDLEEGKEAARKISKVKTKPDGIFAANDETAVGCILELQKLGYKVPNDIAVVGFNNDSVCQIISPELTTINYPAFELGTMVTNHLIEHILGNSNINLTNQIVLKSELIIRNSSNRKPYE